MRSPRRLSRPRLALRRLAALVPLVAASLVAPLHAQTGSVRVEIRNARNAPVADAVASLTSLAANPPAFTPPAAPVVITQQKEEFAPWVTVVAVGTRVSFPNGDKVQHHVFSLSKPKRFDLGLYHGEPRELVTFDKPGVVVLGCNIHDWMAAYVVVLATPHFAKSGADGLAPISALPAGKYRLEVWHPLAAAPVTREILVEDSTVSQVISVTLGVDRRLPRAPESGVGGYR